jgi:hypothetical protein
MVDEQPDVEIPGGPEVDPNDEKYSAFFEAEMSTATRVMGRRNILVDDESNARKYGLEIPSLAMQYVVQSDVLFMESLMLVAGRPASHKSSFAFEIARWVLMYGGAARVYDTEMGKISPKLATNLIGQDRMSERTWQIRLCTSLNVWQQSISSLMRSYRKTFALNRRLEKKEKRLPLMPFCIIIDSLTGRSSTVNIESFEKDSSGDSPIVQGMRNAKAISDWLQNQEWLSMPWYVVMIRHEKEGQIAQTFRGGTKPKTTPGGKAPDFLGGYDFRFSVRDTHRLKDRGYNLVHIKCNKLAFGVDKRECDVRFSWEWMDVGEGVSEQIPQWEWDLATAQFLANFDHASVRDICHVVEGGTKPDPRFNCKQLGLTEVTGHDLGAAVRHDEKLYRDLQDYLHIARWNRFDPHMEIVEEPERKPMRKGKSSK